ncbi:MAG: hypothetical protein AAF351_16005 [Pseudomonadota bacterium]
MKEEELPGYWFRSSRFEIEPGEDSRTNPNLYGRQPANWLRREFVKLGYDVEDVIAEDWGWCVMCQREPFYLWIGCGSVVDFRAAEANDHPPPKEQILWHVFPAAERPFWKYLFRRKPAVSAAFTKLNQQLNTVLENSADIELLSEETVDEILDTFRYDEVPQATQYDDGNQFVVRSGLRWVLAVFSFLFAFIMVLHGTGSPSPYFSYAFGFFCAAIGITSIATGRVRQFFGSLVGITVFAAGLWYLYSEITAGQAVSGSASEPSVLNAVFFLGVFGIPGLMYAWSARFGFKRPVSKDASGPH